MAKPNHLEYARLGVVVGKKTARRAVARNYMKRVMREVFRGHKSEIANLDVVARVHKPFVKKDFVVVREELETLFAGLKKCLARSSS
jgi:ribonuclease P protein component